MECWDVRLAALCLVLVWCKGAPAADFELQSGRPLAPTYVNSATAVTIAAGGVERQCPLGSQPSHCLVQLPRGFLLVDVEVRLTHSVSDVYGEPGLAFEPLRFTMTPNDEEHVIPVRITPASARLDHKAVLLLAATTVPRTGLALQEHFQRARASWVAQSQAVNAGTSAYRIKAAFLLLQAASKLVTDVPPYHADADPQVRSAQEFVQGLSDEKLDQALGKGNARHAKMAAQDVFLTRAEPLERAWQYVRSQPFDRRLGLLDDFEKNYKKTIPEGSNGHDLVARLGITLPSVWAAQVQALASLMACNRIERMAFDERADGLLDLIGSRILREAPVGVVTSAGDLCLARTEARDRSTMTLDLLCPRLIELTGLRVAKRIETKCPETLLENPLEVSAAQVSSVVDNRSGEQTVPEVVR